MNKLVLATALMGTMVMASTAGFAQAPAVQEKGDMHKRMIEKVDTNSDGKISKAEFMARHEEAFAKMDANSDGSLSADEMKVAREQMKAKWQEMKDMKEKHMGMKPEGAVEAPAATGAPATTVAPATTGAPAVTETPAPAVVK